ncbi:hypothetical protein JCM19379_22880 [Methyloparacoccus murrellii]
MTPAERIRAAGFDLRVEAGRLVVSPFSKLSRLHRSYLTQYRDEIVAELLAAGPAANAPQALPPELVSAALAVCRLYGDSETSQEAMLADLAEHPPGHWPALTEHFRAKLTPVACTSCRHARPHPHPAALSCATGVDAGNAVGGWWATDQHLCPWRPREATGSGPAPGPPGPPFSE